MSDSPTSSKGWLVYYRGLIGSWAKNNSRSPDAEDAVQNSALKMLGQSQEAVLDPNAYLFRATRNHLINEVKRQARQPVTSLEALAQDDHPLLSDPEAPVRARQLVDALEAALQQLPLKKRQVFIYHRLEGYTHPEIAARMGISLNTVERYVMDATRHIREKLQNFCEN